MTTLPPIDVDAVDVPDGYEGFVFTVAALVESGTLDGNRKYTAQGGMVGVFDGAPTPLGNMAIPLSADMFTTTDIGQQMLFPYLHSGVRVVDASSGLTIVDGKTFSESLEAG